MPFDFFTKRLKPSPKVGPKGGPKTNSKVDLPEPESTDKDHLTPVLKTPLDDLHKAKTGGSKKGGC